MIKNYMSMTKFSLLFAVALLFAGNTTQAQEARKGKETSAHAFMWSDVEKKGYIKEATEKRSRYTKHFEMNDGSFKMYSSPGSMHYQTATGWEEIDLAIHSNTTGVHSSNPYFNGDNSFKTYYPQSPMSGKVYTKVKDGEMSERIEGLYATDANGQIVYQYQSNTPQSVEVNTNNITYTNLFPNTKVVYAQQAEGRKFAIQLQSAQALSGLPANAKFLVIKEKVTIPSHWTMNEKDGHITLFAGKICIANILKPIATEKQNPDKTYQSEEELSTEGTIHATRNGNELTLYTTFSIDWLKQSDRQFPVNLDPTTNYYPASTIPTSLVTGRLTSATGAKAAGFLRMAAAGSFSWAKFDISTLPAGATISAATYWGYQYNPTGVAADKITTVVGMQGIDPEVAVNNSTTPIISTQINTTGPVYSSTYVFSGNNTAAPPYTWRPATLTGNATGDIAAQQLSQGWTALGFRYTSGNTGTALQRGIEIFVTANAELPYLTLDYTVGSCSGTPVAGTATSTVLLACGDPFTLNLSGNSTGVGTTYQWQSSPAGMNTWTNLGVPQISPNYTTTQAAPTDYQCIVSCTSSGLSSTSTVVAVGQNTVANCYCIPSGPSSSINYISGFTTTGAVINVANTSTTYSTVPSAGYADYTNMAISANPTGVVGVTVTFVTGSHRVGIWADWNQDGDFNDAGENPILSISNGASPFNNSFTVPSTALVGNTRLRVRITNVGAPSACGFDANGETEDYTINVLGPCSSAATASIANTSYMICPLATQVITATVPIFQLGTTFQWKQSATSGGPYTNVVGGSGATTMSYTTPALSAGTYYYVVETSCANCGPCSTTSNEATVLVNNVPAPIATNSAQCAPGVPTAFVTSAAGAIGTGNFNWYSAPTGGTLLQSQPYGPVVPYYFNDFSSITLTNSSISGQASILGGVLQLHPNSVSQYGGFMVNASGFTSDKYTVDFDFANTGAASMGEGFSYSFANDAVITVEGSMSPESGTGSKLKLCFVAFTNGASTQGMYLIYGNNTIPEPTPSSLGVYGYSGNVTWRNATGHVKVSLDSLGRATVTLNGTPVFNNIQLPAAYMATPKLDWKHVWKGRTTTNTMLSSFDNIDIKQSTLVTGTPSYLSSVGVTTTFHVSEMGVNGCASPRTPVTVTVNTPAVISINPIPNDSVCTGAPITLSASNAVSYVWNGTPTVTGDTTFSTAVAGTFTVTGTDANSCTNTKTVTIYLHPVLNGTATATPNVLCLGSSTDLTATATPICTGLTTASFMNYYTPALWTLTNVSANGTLNTTGSPANVKVIGGSDGSFNFGTTSFSRKITCTGTITLNWTFLHPTDAYDDYPQYSINGGTPVDLPGYNQFSGNYNASQSGTMTIPVVDGDSISFDVVTINNDATPGQLTLLNFVAPSPKITGTISYWDAATGGNNLGTPPLSATPLVAGTATYYAEYTANGTGCVNVVRQPVSVTVHDLPTATMTGGGTVCAGSTLPDVSIALTGAGPWDVTYTYNSNPVTVTGVVASPYVLTNAAVGSYAVTNVLDANCTGTVSGSATVAEFILPTATVSGGGSVCAGSTLPDVSIALTGSGPWSVTYTDGTTPSTVNGIASSPYTITGATPGNYVVTNVSDINCTGTASGNAVVVVNTLPTVTATMTPPTICYATTAVAAGGGALTYTWDNGISDNTPFVGTATTTYMVIGTDANSCTATSTVTLTVTSVGNNLAQATAGNVSSVTGFEDDTNVQPDGSSIIYSDASCNLIATIADVPGGNSLGSTTTTVRVEANVLTYPAVGGQPYSRRWYMIVPTNNVGVNADVTIYQAQDDFDDYNAANGAYPDMPTGPFDLAGIANIRVTKISGGTLGVGTAGVITPSSVIWNATTNYWEITFNVTGSFSEFYVHVANPLGAALPVNLTSFTGQKQGDMDILKWTTAAELNNASFNLQHSTDGQHFATIANVASKAANGNSSSILNYQYTHTQPVAGHNYYRLQQVDIDGYANMHGNVVILNRSINGNNVSIYPNPVSDVLNIELFTNEETGTVIKITDMSGRLVKQVQAKTVRGMNTITISMEGLSAGLYTAQLLENGKVSFTERIRKD